MKTPSVFISDLTAIIATYLDMSTAMAEREAEVATFSIRRGGSNSIVLQYYCKVLQYFGIATSQNNSISIAKS